MKQRFFASLNFDSEKKPTLRERFPGEMEKLLFAELYWRCFNEAIPGLVAEAYHR